MRGCSGSLSRCSTKSLRATLSSLAALGLKLGRTDDLGGRLARGCGAGAVSSRDLDRPPRAGYPGAWPHSPSLVTCRGPRQVASGPAPGSSAPSFLPSRSQRRLPQARRRRFSTSTTPSTWCPTAASRPMDCAPCWRCGTRAKPSWVVLSSIFRCVTQCTGVFGRYLASLLLPFISPVRRGTWLHLCSWLPWAHSCVCQRGHVGFQGSFLRSTQDTSSP